MIGRTNENFTLVKDIYIFPLLLYFISISITLQRGVSIILKHTMYHTLVIGKDLIKL